VLYQLLHDSPSVMTTATIASALGWGQRRAATTLSFLADEGAVAVARVARTRVYWHLDRPFYPESGISGAVSVAAIEKQEDEILERAGKHLKSTLFLIDAEHIAGHELAHLPLWQAHVHGHFPEGLIFKKSRKRSGTLYFHASRGRLCSLVPDRGFAFGDFAGEAPDSVQDLDEVVEWEERHPGDLELNPELMERLIPRKKIEEALTKKHGMVLDGLELVFLPCWKMRIVENDKDSAEERLLVLDAVLGLPVEL